MKKVILFIIIAISFALNSFAETVKTDSIQPKSQTETAQAINVVYDKIELGITTLASQLKAPVEHVWELTIKQQKIESISDSFIFVVFMLISIFLIVLPVKLAKKNNDDLDDNPFYFVPVLIGAALVITSSIMAICNFSNIVTGFANPEYGAIQDILNAIK